MLFLEPGAGELVYQQVHGPANRFEVVAVGDHRSGSSGSEHIERVGAFELGDTGTQPLHLGLCCLRSVQQFVDLPAIARPGRSTVEVIVGLAIVPSII